MKHKFVKIGIIAILAVLILPFPVSAQEEIPDQAEPVITDTLPQEEYLTGKVLEILEEEETEFGGSVQVFQLVKVEITSGERKGEIVEIEHGGLFATHQDQRVKGGERVVLVGTQTAEGQILFIADKYRITPLIMIFALFLGLVVLFGRLRGLGSIFGMVISVIVLVAFVVPRIVEGQNPLLVSLGGAVVVAVLSLYLAHGFNKRTSIALASTILTLGIASGLAVFFVSFTKLIGFGTEEAYYLQILGSNQIDLRGLLLGGIIIGALGVLDDITIGQSATIHEISKANPSLTFSGLYDRGLSVGREHIASLVNTLVFAYAGAAFPLLLIFTLNDNLPLWVIINSELIAEEIVRTLVGSTALIFAVPITTILAAHFFSKKSEPKI